MVDGDATHRALVYIYVLLRGGVARPDYQKVLGRAEMGKKTYRRASRLLGYSRPLQNFGCGTDAILVPNLGYGYQGTPCIYDHSDVNAALRTIPCPFIERSRAITYIGVETIVLVSSGIQSSQRQEKQLTLWYLFAFPRSSLAPRSQILDERLSLQPATLYWTT